MNVYAVEGASVIGPAAVLFLLHGRQGSAEDADPVARNILQDIIDLTKEGQPQSHDLLIVTFVSFLRYRERFYKSDDNHSL